MGLYRFAEVCNGLTCAYFELYQILLDRLLASADNSFQVWLLPSLLRFFILIFTTCIFRSVWIVRMRKG